MTDILALDLARKTGWARGPAGKIPVSGSWELVEPGAGGGLAAGALARQLVAHKREFGVPDLMILEQYIAPNRKGIFRTDKSIEMALRLNGAAHALMGGVYGVMIVEPAPATVRAEVCGQASAVPRGRGARTSREIAESRAATKKMVCKVVKMLGLLPAASDDDDDRADALCCWRWAEAHYGRRAPQQFVLT